MDNEPSIQHVNQKLRPDKELNFNPKNKRFWLLICYISSITSAISCTIVFTKRQPIDQFDPALTANAIIFASILATRTIAIVCNRNCFTFACNTLSVTIFVVMYFFDLGIVCFTFALMFLGETSLYSLIAFVSSLLLITVPVNTSVYAPD